MCGFFTSLTVQHSRCEWECGNGWPGLLGDRGDRGEGPPGSEAGERLWQQPWGDLPRMLQLGRRRH